MITMKRKLLLAGMTCMLCLAAFSGCGTKVEDNSDKKESITATETTEEATEVTGAAASEETAEERTVEYGDTIRVSVVQKVKGALSEAKGVDVYEEDKGEATFVVSKDSSEFDLSDTGLTEEEIMTNVNKAVGKKVGETFTLSNEFGDGTYSYEYTILEIVNGAESETDTDRPNADTGSGF